MVKQVKHDFTVWKNFPSSLRAENNEGSLGLLPLVQRWLTVSSGSIVKVTIDVKAKNVVEKGVIVIRGLKSGIDTNLAEIIHIPEGTFEWTTLTSDVKIPEDVGGIYLNYHYGSGSSALIGQTWLGGLKIYQDNQLIYSDDFSNWNPYIGAGVGALIGIPAYTIAKKRKPLIAISATVAGIAIGAIVGYLTAKP